MMWNTARRPPRVHQVPAAVIVAAGTDREPWGQIERPPNHSGTCVVRLQYRLEPTLPRNAIGIEEDQRIPPRGSSPQVAGRCRIPTAARSFEHQGTGTTSRRGGAVGRAIVYHDHLEFAIGRTLR